MAIKERPKSITDLSLPSGELKELLSRETTPEAELVSRESTSVCFTPYSLVKQSGRKIKITPLRCKCWSCKRCAPLKKKQLRWMALKGRPTKMITLTVSSQAGPTPTARARSLVTAWRQVRRKARKEFRQSKIEFLAVFEKTEAGEPHLHILTRMQYVPQAWLSAQMGKLICSPIVHIRAIKSKKVASWYVSKYVAKDPTRFEGTKRFWRSFDYMKKPKKPPGNASNNGDKFYVVRSVGHRCLLGLLRRGYTLIQTMESYTLAWLRAERPPYMPGTLSERGP